MNYKRILPVLMLLALFACDSVEPEIQISYSFFAAGHVYGNPMTYSYGFHPPLDSNISYLNGYPSLEFGVFTGDVVPHPSADYWDSLQVDLNKIKVPYYIAPGNHDRGEEFLKRYEHYYQSFYFKNDLFIVLTPTNWNIEGEQMDFLKKTLNDNNDSTNNIFIFLHELIWWSPDNQFKDVDINWVPHYPGSTNYWDEVDPLLRKQPNKIVIFAGDIGCNTGKTPCMYYEYNNITLIASGMGNKDHDNLVITDVYKDGTFKFNLIYLNSDDKNGMGSLEDYRVE